MRLHVLSVYPSYIYHFDSIYTSNNYHNQIGNMYYELLFSITMALWYMCSYNTPVKN